MNYQLEYTKLVSATGVDATMIDKSMPPPASPMDGWLDTTIQDAWERTFAFDDTNYRRFVAAGFLLLRDAMTAGKKCVAETDHVAESHMKDLNRILTANTYGIDWHDEPIPEYLASFCTRLSQVHSGVLGLGQPNPRASVLDALEVPADERPYLFQLNIGGYVYPPLIPKISAAPELFAVRFELARREQERKQPSS